MLQLHAPSPKRKNGESLAFPRRCSGTSPYTYLHAFLTPWLVNIWHARNQRADLNRSENHAAKWAEEHSSQGPSLPRVCFCQRWQPRLFLTWLTGNGPDGRTALMDGDAKQSESSRCFASPGGRLGTRANLVKSYHRVGALVGVKSVPSHRWRSAPRRTDRVDKDSRGAVSKHVDLTRGLVQNASRMRSHPWSHDSSPEPAPGGVPVRGRAFAGPIEIRQGSQRSGDRSPMPRQNVSLSLASRAHSGVLHAARTAYRHPRMASDDARTVGTDSADMASCFVQKDELARISSLTLSGISLAEREENVMEIHTKAKLMTSSPYLHSAACRYVYSVPG